jgi:hypothetical protein
MPSVQDFRMPIVRSPFVPHQRLLHPADAEGDKILSRMLCCPLCLTTGHYGHMCPLANSVSRLPAPFLHPKPLGLSPMALAAPMRGHPLPHVRPFAGSTAPPRHAHAPPTERTTSPERHSPHAGDTLKRGEQNALHLLHL